VRGGGFQTALLAAERLAYPRRGPGPPGLTSDRYRGPFIGVAQPGVQIPLPWELPGVLAGNDSSDARQKELYAYGQGLLCGRIWARGIDGDLKLVKARIQAWLALGVGRISVDLAQGLGEGFAKQSRDWEGLRELLALVGPRTEEFWRGFGRGLRIRLDDASRVDRERLERFTGGDEMRAFDDGWHRAYQQDW
jgi:hypothetical protein